MSRSPVERYVDRAGWWLLLTGPGHKRPHWRFHDVHDATRDVGLLLGYLEETPDAGIAVNLGRSRLAVVEDDGPEGLEALARLEGEHEPLPGTLEFGSRRGTHRLFDTGGAQVAGRTLATDLELKSRGQYVILPPSTLHGVRRRWVAETVRRPIAPLPHWLAQAPEPEPVEAAEMVSSDLLAQAAVNEARTRLALRPASPGTNRGTALFAAACDLARHVHAGTLDRAVAVAVLDEAARRLRMSAYERDRSINRGLRIGPERNA